MKEVYMYNDYLNRKEKIIITAIDLLDESGIQGLTTKEIANRQGISEPAVYKQFDGKKDIVLNILDRFAVFDEFIKNTILDNKMSPKASIDFYFNSYLEYYENYPQITTVLFSFDVYRYQEDTNEKMKNILQDRLNFLSDLISKGQETGELERDLESRELAERALGIIWSYVFNWKLNGCVDPLKNKTLAAARSALGISTPSE
jgi:AcrR family transcriptional regulator